MEQGACRSQRPAVAVPHNASPTRAFPACAEVDDLEGSALPLEEGEVYNLPVLPLDGGWVEVAATDCWARVRPDKLDSLLGLAPPPS